MSITEFPDYRSYLKQRILATRQRGVQAELARAARISPSHMSKVLQGETDLSLDQAFRIGRHLRLEERELRQFLTLVNIGRACSEDLRLYLRSWLSN